MHCMPRKRGFTLIELLVVVALVAVIGMAVFATIANGLRIWKMASQQLADEDAQIFLDKFTVDVRNSFEVRTNPVVATDDAFEFMTMVKVPVMDVVTVGKVIYVFDSSSNKIERREADFVTMASHDESLTSTALKDVSRARISYYCRDPLTKELSWVDEYAAGHLPFAVRLEFSQERSGKSTSFVKTVNIPMGT